MGPEWESIETQNYRRWGTASVPSEIHRPKRTRRCRAAVHDAESSTRESIVASDSGVSEWKGKLVLASIQLDEG
jgi:hypothetical protein